MFEYKHYMVRPAIGDDLDTLNGAMAEKGWRVHTMTPLPYMNDRGTFAIEYSVLFERIKEEHSAKPEPMAMRSG